MSMKDTISSTKRMVCGETWTFAEVFM
jgi:hypothetical protein